MELNWRPHAIGETPCGEVVGGKISGKETVSTNKSDGVCMDGTRGGIIRAEAGTLDDWFGVERKFKIVDCPMVLIGGGSNLFVPFQECLVWLQAEVLKRRENSETGR